MRRSSLGWAATGLLMLIAALLLSQARSWNSTAGATFHGVDPSGHKIRVHLFGLVGGNEAPAWQGWLFQDGTGLLRDEYSTNREVWPISWTDPKSTNPVVIEARPIGDAVPPSRLAILFGPGATALVTREFSHRVLHRRRGFQFNGWGCIKEYRGEFPDLRGGDALTRAVLREIESRCDSEARHFTGGILSHTREAWRAEWPATMGWWTLEEQWQVRLLSEDIASVAVWSYPQTGGNGNPTRVASLNWIRDGDHLRELDLSDLFRRDLDWETALRRRCIPKLDKAHAFDPTGVMDPRIPLAVFTMSPEGLQLYFNPYTIGSGAEGFFVIHFEEAELADLLRPQGPMARRH